MEKGAAEGSGGAAVPCNLSQHWLWLGASCTGSVPSGVPLMPLYPKVGLTVVEGSSISLGGR